MADLLPSLGAESCSASILTLRKVDGINQAVVTQWPKLQFVDDALQASRPF